jgi:hypothetical protein
MPTIDEIIEWQISHFNNTNRLVGIYPELKHPDFYNSMGYPMENLLLQKLKEKGYHTDYDDINTQILSLLVRARFQGLRRQGRDYSRRPASADRFGGAAAVRYVSSVAMESRLSISAPNTASNSARHQASTSPPAAAPAAEASPAVSAGVPEAAPPYTVAGTGAALTTCM